MLAGDRILNERVEELVAAVLRHDRVEKLGSLLLLRLPSLVGLFRACLLGLLLRLFLLLRFVLRSVLFLSRSLLRRVLFLLGSLFRHLFRLLRLLVHLLLRLLLVFLRLLRGLLDGRRSLGLRQTRMSTWNVNCVENGQMHTSVSAAALVFLSGLTILKLGVTIWG